MHKGHKGCSRGGPRVWLSSCASAFAIGYGGQVVQTLCPLCRFSYFFADPSSSIARKMAFITIFAAAGGFITAPLESMAGLVL